MVQHHLTRTITGMEARVSTAALLTLTMFGCAQTQHWQHASDTASLASDTVDCATQAKLAYPVRMIGHRVVDEVATLKARETFTQQAGYKTVSHIKPPVVYRTREYDINRHARSRAETECLKSKGWTNLRLISS